VRLVCVPDEETGGARGAGRLSRDRLLGLNGIGMLTAEPTGGLVWNANRGALSLRVGVTGKPAHVGLHFRGVNAFEGMLEIARDLRALARRVARRVTRHRLHPPAARRSVLLIGGQCGGGTSFNTVSGGAWFTVDRRFNPEERLADVRAALEALFRQHGRAGRRLTIETLQEGASAATPSSAPFGRALAAAVRAVGASSPRFEMCPGLLETRFYAARGIPAYAYGPGQFSVAHLADEYVDLDRVVECAAVYALTALRVLS
jgi:acetylornithine deacetylase/succinyl-diaminopimelate desuccinylase-like protein